MNFKGILNLTMVSDDKFYASFRDSVIGPDPDPGDLTNQSHRVSFLMHHYDMIPLRDRDFFGTGFSDKSAVCLFSTPPPQYEKNTK